MIMNHRETEKYTKGFILKCMNVIIESRLGEMVVRKCSPTRNDWFNIALNDNEEVSTSCLECLDNLHWIDPTIKDEPKLNSGFTIDARWKVTCEVSLKTHEGKTLSLEYWMFENKPINLNAQSPTVTSPIASSSPGASPISDPTSGSPIPSSRNASSFANVHSKMGLMIKSLMSLARGTPSFKLSNVGHNDQSHIICYRICQCDVDFDTFLRSINPEIADDVHKQFSPETKLGSIRTNNNSIEVSFCYRVNLETCRLLDPTAKIEDNPITIKEDHFGGGRTQEKTNTPEADRNSPCFVDRAREPRLAFGSLSPIVLPFPLLPPLPKDFPGISDESDNDDDLLGSCFINNRKTLTPTVTPTTTDLFSGNMKPTKPTAENTTTTTTTIPTTTATTTVGSTSTNSASVSSLSEMDKKDSPTLEKKVPNASKPIVIPSDRRNNNYRQPRLDNSPEPPVGSGESYVFVDNRPPFAPDHDDIEILFTGPTPSFITNPSGGSELLNIQQTLDAMETEMLSIDDFLESLEIKSDEDDDNDEEEEEEEEEKEKSHDESEENKHKDEKLNEYSPSIHNTSN